jgi:hypothetical protein
MRTEMGMVNLKSNGKYSVSFKTFKGQPGNEWVAFEAESAPVFDTEEAAYAGGVRALDCLAVSGRFPNMCEQF